MIETRSSFSIRFCFFIGTAVEFHEGNLSIFIFDEKLEREESTVVYPDGHFVGDAESAYARLDQGDAITMRGVLVAQEGCHHKRGKIELEMIES